MWPGSDDWRCPSLPQIPFQPLKTSIPHSHLWEDGYINASDSQYKEAVMGDTHIKIPNPFPVQQISFQPEPIHPLIVLEEKGDHIFKVVAVVGIGGGGMDGSHHQWGSMLITMNDAKDNYRIVSDSYDPRDQIIWALDDAGFLAPRSFDSLAREF